MLNIILCGAPGSGKGTQSDLIVKEYGLQHLSTGDVLRSEMKSGSALGKELETIISSGNLVSDDKMIALIEHYLEMLPADTKGVIFDGFPRTVAQAEALTALLSRRGLQAIVLDMMVEKESLITRLIERGKTSGRADDNEEAIRHRQAVYEEVTKPVSLYYLNQKNYFAINGNFTIEQTFAQIRNILTLCK